MGQPRKIKDEIKEKSKEISLVETPNMAMDTPDRFDPVKEVEFATKCAKALMQVVKQKKKPVIINKEQYLEFEDWQTIARFYNCVAGIESTNAIINAEDIFAGYEAKAIVKNAQGVIISSAEASCLKDEENWKSKPIFQLKSMAQTRAMAKALRNVFAWVVVLEGFKPTPVEELNDRNYPSEPFPSRNPARKPAAKTTTAKKDQHFCVDCKELISDKVCSFSLDVYGAPYCMKCQPNHKKVNK